MDNNGVCFLDKTAGERFIEAYLCIVHQVTFFLSLSLFCIQRRDSKPKLRYIKREIKKNYWERCKHRPQTNGKTASDAEGKFFFVFL